MILNQEWEGGCLEESVGEGCHHVLIGPPGEEVQYHPPPHPPPMCTPGRASYLAARQGSPGATRAWIVGVSRDEQSSLTPAS